MKCQAKIVDACGDVFHCGNEATTELTIINGISKRVKNLCTKHAHRKRNILSYRNRHLQKNIEYLSKQL